MRIESLGTRCPECLAMSRTAQRAVGNLALAAQAVEGADPTAMDETRGWLRCSYEG